MIQKYKKPEYTLEMFESEMLDILKDLHGNRLELDGRLFYQCRRLGCVLSVRDLHINGQTGQMVMVGSYVAGKRLEESEGNMIDIPLYECFADMQAMGNHIGLINKAKKATIAKLIDEPFMYAVRHGLVKKNIEGLLVMNFENIGFKPLLLGRSSLVGVGRREDGSYVLFDTSYPSGLTVSNYSFRTIQRAGNIIMSCNSIYSEASEVYVTSMRDLLKVDMSYSRKDYEDSVSASLGVVRDAGYCPVVLDAVKKIHTSGWDYVKALDFKENIEKTKSNKKNRLWQ